MSEIGSYLNGTSLEGICSSGWIEPNHFLFQLANAFLLLSYFATTSIFGLIYLRACLALGCLCYAVWGWVILCALDTLCWNAGFTLINLIHIFILLYCLRPIGFEPEIEQVYIELFKPLKVSRHLFKKFIDCAKEVRTLKPPDTFCVEKKGRLDQLSLVLSGRLVVTQAARILHVVTSLQFLDSAEWFGVCASDQYQVTITALTECRILVWRRDKLNQVLQKELVLKAAVDSLLGRDVVRKLLLANDRATINGTALFPIPSQNAASVEDSETASLLASHQESQSKPSTLKEQVEKRSRAASFSFFNFLRGNLSSKKKKEEIIDAETTV